MGRGGGGAAADRQLPFAGLLHFDHLVFQLVLGHAGLQLLLLQVEFHGAQSRAEGRVRLLTAQV